MQVELALFGAFRSLQGTGPLLLELPEGATVSDLKSALVRRVEGSSVNAGLVAVSAVATDREILQDDEILPGPALCILPPVCGG